MSKHFAPYVPISMGPLCAKVTKTISLNLFFKGYLVMLLSQENQGIQALFSQKNKKDGAFNKSIVQEVIWEEICPRLVWRVDRVNNLQLSFRYNERPNFCLISIRHSRWVICETINFNTTSRNKKSAKLPWRFVNQNDVIFMLAQGLTKTSRNNPMWNWLIFI